MLINSIILSFVLYVRTIFLLCVRALLFVCENNKSARTQNKNVGIFARTLNLNAHTLNKNARAPKVAKLHKILHSVIVILLIMVHISSKSLGSNAWFLK